MKRVRASDWGWSRAVGHHPCAWCWLLGVDKYLCLPQPDLHGVCVYALENFKMNLPVSSWGLKTGPGYYVSGGGDVHAGTPRRICECDVHKG